MAAAFAASTAGARVAAEARASAEEDEERSSGLTPIKTRSSLRPQMPTSTPGPHLAPKPTVKKHSEKGELEPSVGLPKKKGSPWVIPVRYYVPRKVAQKAFETIDGHDSPDRPGLIKEASLRAMGDRFNSCFGSTEKHKAEFEATIDHLRRHTRRRRGDAILDEGFLEWENTSRVYEMFKVDLNIFERIFFTVDVSESTSVLSKFCSLFLIGTIILSIVNWMVSTLPEMTEVPPCKESPPPGMVSFGYLNDTATWCCTEPGDCAPEAKGFFKAVEVVTVLIFTAEYLIRLFTVHSVRFELLNEYFLEWNLSGDVEEGVEFASYSISDKQNQLDGPGMTTVKHIFGTSNLIDLLSILPFWIERLSDDGSGASVLVILRILRLTRIFRVFKLGKYNDVFTMFSAVIAQSIPALGLMIFFIAMALCLFGTLIWFAEQGTWYPEGHPTLEDMGISDRGAWLRNTSSTDPEALDETPFPSIIHSYWYVIVTITTVGYGDSFPTTSAGKFVATLLILCGIVVLAMPVGVVGANFSNEYALRETEKKRRIKLKKQQEQTALVEQEQDAAADQELQGKSVSEATETKHSLAAELRQKIVLEAEEMEVSWKDVFPEERLEWISRCLRQFVSEFVDGALNSGKAMTKGQRLTNLPHRLDQLHLRFTEACAQSVSYDELAEFNLMEAREKRRRFAMFADKIWEYWASVGPPEIPSDPFEYFELKAQLTTNMKVFDAADDNKQVQSAPALLGQRSKTTSLQMLAKKALPSAPALMTQNSLTPIREPAPAPPHTVNMNDCQVTNLE